MIDAEDLNPWSFPTAEEYAERLDANGFDVDSTPLFLRPTPLPSEVTDWVDTFPPALPDRMFRTATGRPC